jgi:hypothetical protein
MRRKGSFSFFYLLLFSVVFDGHQSPHPSVLLEVLSHWAKLEDVDFVLVCFNKLNYDAALRVRKQRPCFFTDDVLSKKLKQKAVILAQQARSGHVAIFVGAGYA